MKAEGERRIASDLDGEALLRDNLPLIDRVIERVCHHAGLYDADAEDFASLVKLALIEEDYAILRAWQQRASLATYLTVTVRRLLFDERNRARGRWEPSAEARRGGQAAIVLETVVRRDLRTIEEALPMARAFDPSLTRERAEALLARMPERRPRPRAMPLDEVAPDVLRTSDRADTAVEQRELHRLSLEASQVVRNVLASFSIEDRTIVRLHFAGSMSLADIARMLRLPQRPLYRRLEAILNALRRALVASGIDSGESLIGSAVQALDFGFDPDPGKLNTAPQSISTGDSNTGATP